MKILMYLTQRVFRKQIGISLILGIVIFFGFAEITLAYESFEVGIGAWQGFAIRSGMSEISPTIITIIIGDANEITSISSPEIQPLFEFSPQVDLYFGLTIDPDDPIEVIAEQIAGMAVVEDTVFEDVTDDLLATLDVTERVVTIDHNDLVVLLTNENEYVLLADVTKYPDATVSFTYWKSEIPEVFTLVLLGVGIVGLFGIMRQKRQNRSRKGGKFMKHIKTLILVLVLLPLLVGTAMAADVEVRVIKVGTGDGFVKGEHIWCGDQCRRTYEEGTVVHLKARPDPYSRFVGWLVNEQPHEGVLRIEEDTLIKAIFESNIPPDEMTVIWYAGDTKGRATAVRDEMIVYLDWLKYNEQVGFFSDEGGAYIAEVARQVHPQAKFHRNLPNRLFLRLPEPLSKEELITRMMDVRDMEFVKWADFVFYFDPEQGHVDPEQRNEVSRATLYNGEILVQFPPHYTDEQIRAIEAEYGLTRIEPDIFDNSFVYQAGEHAMEAVETARRLYESGLVEYALISWGGDFMEDHARPADPMFQAGDQWNLQTIGLESAWEISQGAGSLIAIVTRGGVQITHQDLAPNHYDGSGANSIYYVKSSWLSEEHDPSPESGLLRELQDFFDTYSLDPESLSNSAIQQFVATHPGLTFHGEPVIEDTLRKWRNGYLTLKHGTRVVGIAAAEGFNEERKLGISGAAPLAKFVAFNLWGIDDNEIAKVEAKAFARNRERVDIYNKSRGPVKTKAPGKFYDYKKHILSAFEKGAKKGRDGKGNIFVVSCGNDRVNGNMNNLFANSRYTIAVAASDSNNTYSGYSNYGAHVLVNAPSQASVQSTFATTDVAPDNPDSAYTYRFNGTSAATPLVSQGCSILRGVHLPRWPPRD